MRFQTAQVVHADLRLDAVAHQLKRQGHGWQPIEHSAQYLDLVDDDLNCLQKLLFLNLSLDEDDALGAVRVVAVRLL